MSYWTHIAGLIRIDRTPFTNPVEMDFGSTVKFDDKEDAWEKCNVPCGSEGSLEYKLMIYDNENCTSHSQLVIWGDLRDFDNNKEIEDWLDRVVKKISNVGYIRQGVLQANDAVYLFEEDRFVRIDKCQTIK